MQSKPAQTVLAAFALAVTAGCGTMSEGTLIDFGPEPGTPGDPSYWQFQPQLHGSSAPPREQTRPAERARTPETAAGAAPSPTGAAPAADAGPAAPAAAAIPELPPPPERAPTRANPVSEAMFNDAIRRAVAGGDIDRALRLLEEAERLGSTTARATFIEALESR